MKNFLSRKERQQLEELTAVCNEADGTGYAPCTDADAFFLSYHGQELVSALCVYRLGEMRKKRAVEEVVLLTHPSFRNRGRMGKLLRKYEAQKKKHASAEANGPGVVMRFDAYPSEVAASYLKQIGALHSHDECVLMLDMAEAQGPAGTDEKSPELTRISVSETEGEEGERNLQVQNLYSACGVRLQGKRGFLHSVRTDRNHLRQGSARAMLESLIGMMGEQFQAETLGLCVSSKNRPAFELYKKLGFRETQRIEVWYLE